MPRFPTRTLVLMTLALISFGWFFWKTHAQATAPKAPTIIPVLVVTDGGVP